MQTAEFAANLEQLIKLAGKEPIALMCAEAAPWRCHRSLIADALTVRGIPVEHIASTTRRQPHILTPWARVDGLRVTYPAEAAAKQQAGNGHGSPSSGYTRPLTDVTAALVFRHSKED